MRNIAAACAFIACCSRKVCACGTCCCTQSVCGSGCVAEFSQLDDDDDELVVAALGTHHDLDEFDISLTTPGVDLELHAVDGKQGDEVDMVVADAYWFLCLT